MSGASAALFGPWLPGLGEPERLARWRSLRALAMVYCGATHPLTVALRAAERDPAAAAQALRCLDALPALRRRRVLATYAALARP